MKERVKYRETFTFSIWGKNRTVVLFSVSKSKIPERVPTFDIYAPNIKFKKSAPGVPDHRVCVSK